ncbi:pentatricopeptide repeat-containing protein [Corchorus olitorius]|uniref:Pentatricopeptide repeat-containing protein n=1 Tax=Corchorus olitorius TaxID=93759 RepID=A0A1R3GQW1_9ROSI|nr:pentatricopeptide repeat-containing protein [Corchorus olitorius]
MAHEEMNMTPIESDGEENDVQVEWWSAVFYCPEIVIKRIKLAIAESLELLEKKGDPRWEVDPIAADIRALMKDFEGCKIRWSI